MRDDDGVSAQGSSALDGVRHLARESAVLLSSGVVSYVGAFALQVLLARLLGEVAFGAWAVAFSLAITLSTFGLMGADWIILRQGAYYHGMNDEPRLRKTMYLALWLSSSGLGVLGIGLFMLAPLVAASIFDQPDLAPMLRVVAFTAPVMGISQVLVFGTQAFKRMKESALIRNILQPTARLACVGLALAITATPLSAVTGLLGAEVLLAAVSAWALNRRLALRGPTDSIDRRGLIRFALPVWPTKFVDQSRSQLFPLLLGSLATLSASGAFIASHRVAVAPAAIIATINTVYKPMGSDLYLRGRVLELATLFKSIGKWSFVLGFPLFCYQLLFPEEILSLFGESFRDARTALMLLAIGMLFNFSTGPVGSTLIIAGRAQLTLIDHVVVVALEIGLGLWLIPTYGLIGAGVSRMIGTALNNCLALAQVRFLLGFHPYKWDYWKPLAAGVLAAGTARLVVDMSGLPVGVAAAFAAALTIAAAYVLVLLVLGLSTEDRAALDVFTRRLQRRRTEPASAGGDGLG